jgi:hypothetical protein
LKIQIDGRRTASNPRNRLTTCCKKKRQKKNRKGCHASRFIDFPLPLHYLQNVLLTYIFFSIFITFCVHSR